MNLEPTRPIDVRQIPQQIEFLNTSIDELEAALEELKARVSPATIAANDAVVAKEEKIPLCELASTILGMRIKVDRIKAGISSLIDRTQL